MPVTALKHEPSGILAWISVGEHADKPNNGDPNNGTEVFGCWVENRNILRGFIASEAGKVCTNDRSVIFSNRTKNNYIRNSPSVCVMIAEKHRL
jgi:hypothetical protein